jgi:3-dehydroquinate synthase
LATLNVELGNRSYPIIVGNGLLRDEALLAPYISGDEVVVLTNETIAPLYLDQVTTSLKDRQLICQVLPDGEQFKNLDTLQSIFDTLLENRCSRATE